MRLETGSPILAAQHYDFYRQGANIHPHASHHVFFWQRLLLAGVGFVSDGTN
jgi:hypothetical protein